MSASRDETREAGRELDAAICRALGWASMIGDEEIFWRTEYGATTGRRTPPALSTEIVRAFQVVEAMRAKGWRVTVQQLPEHWRCEFEDGSDNYSEEYAETAAHAISLAALAALESDAPEKAAVSPSLDTEDTKK